jgi:isopentenyl-diphosphate delta-isomerase
MEHITDPVILVDDRDNETGIAGKLEAHRKGLLHRAFSVFVFNSKGELMLQKRADAKYHSGGLWSNTCCSHPFPGESSAAAAHRRLMEEMGFSTDLIECFSFIYKEKLDNDLTEHEYDHVFIGRTENAPSPNPQEVQDWKWMNMDELKQELDNNSPAYTVWLRIVFERVYEYLRTFPRTSR